MGLDRETILVVDDKDDSRRQLSDRLEAHGYVVVTAHTVNQALELMQADPVDLLLLALSCATRDDYRIITTLKRDSTLSQTPIVVISGDDQPDALVRCLELGAEDYLHQPIREALFTARIEANLERKYLRHDHQANQIALKEARQANSEFISFIAHELRTPMTSIKGYADLLKSGALGAISDAQANFLQTITANANRMATLVTHLNDLSKIEADRLVVEFDAVAVRDVVDKVIKTMETQIADKQQALDLQIPDDLPPVQADAGHLDQILSNLVSNAHHYTPEGGRITLTAEVTQDQAEQADGSTVVQITVSDTGYGVSPADRAKIFDKFFRSEEPDIRDAPGAGLGLHLTKHLVEIHKGKIWFESEPNQGTTFHVTIPAAPEA